MTLDTYKLPPKILLSENRYRALTRNELTAALESAGFARITWHEPEQSGYFQPIVTALT